MIKVRMQYRFNDNVIGIQLKNIVVIQLKCTRSTIAKLFEYNKYYNIFIITYIILGLLILIVIKLKYKCGYNLVCVEILEYNLNTIGIRYTIGIY